MIDPEDIEEALPEELLEWLLNPDDSIPTLTFKPRKDA